MADAIVVRNGKGSAAVVGPTDDRESSATVADRQSVSSCSSQETVLGAGDDRCCRRADLPTGNGYENSDGGDVQTTASGSEHIDGNTDNDDEVIFYDEQPQMALMSPLVTRWRRAQAGGGSKVDSANNNSLLLSNGKQSCHQHANSNQLTNASGVVTTSGSGPGSSSGRTCPPINTHVVDGYATLRNRKSASDKSPSITGHSSGNDLSGFGASEGNAGMPRFPTSRGDNRFPLSSTLTTANPTTVNRKLDEVDTKALQQLHQPWRRVTSYGSDGEHKSSTRKLPNIAHSPNSVDIKLGPLAKSSVGNENCVGTGCGGGTTASRAPLAATNSYEVDGRSKRKPAVGKLSLFDRLPAFMLQSHQTKQQPHLANSCSSVPSSSAVTPPNASSPKATAATTTFAATRRSPDVHLTQSTRAGAQLRKKPGSVRKTAGIQPPKFDDTDEEALSPMVTSTYSPSGTLPDVTCGDVSQPSSVFESSPLPPGCSPTTSTDRGGPTGARSPSTDRLPLGGGDRPPYAGLLPFPVMPDSVSSASCHSNNNGRQMGDPPRSAISSYETTDEQNNAAEIRRLRQDLKWAREQVQLFTARLSTNTSVVEAFDQSLCNMAGRLQRIASSNLLDVGELGELHATICTLRRQNWSQLPPDRGPIDMSLTPPLPSPPRTPVSLTHEPWQHLQLQQQQQQQLNGMHGASATTQGVARAGARDILRRQTSSESVASVGSASSAISSLSVQTTCGVESGDHKHRTVKNWLRSSFGKAFARRKAAPRDSSIGRSTASSSVSIVGSEGSVRRDGGPAYTGSMPTIADPTAMYNASRRVSAGDRHGSASTIGGPDVSRPMASFPEIPSRMPGHLSAMSFVRGSETRSSKTSIMSLPARTMTAPLTSSKPMSDIVGSDELLFDGRRAMTTNHKRSESVGQTVALPRFTSNDSIRSSREGTAMLSEVPPLVSGGHRLAVSVLIRSPGGTDVVKLKAGCSQTKDLVIGSLTVNCSTTWLQLDRLIRRTFQDYLIRLDPATSIGLSGESVHSYRIGEVVRRKESDQPELLPIGYVVGDVSNISITLKGSTENAVDRLAFELLVPKLILQRYVSLLIEHRRVILSGSTGTGKTFLAQRLAEFIVETCGVEATPDNVAVFQVDNQSSRELRHYLTNIAGQCTAVADSTTATTAHDDDDDDAMGVRYRSPLTTTITTTTLPRVVILDNLHRVSSLSDVFNGFLSVPYQCCPYVIGTMNQTTSCSAADLQMHHNFRWVLYANHIEPVRSFLGRFLRRQHMSSVTMATLAATSPIRNTVGLKDHRQQQQGSPLTGNVVDATSGGGSGDAGRVVDWLPKVWLRINQFLEAHTSCDITIGPRLFLSCPMDFDQAEVWFADLWNYSIVPYMLEAVRDGIQGHGCRGQWEELADWVTETYPWRVRATSNHNGNQSPHHQMKTSTPLSDSVSHPSSARPSVGTGSASCTAMLSLPLLRLRLEDVGYGGGVTSTGVSHVTRRGTTTTTALQPPQEMDDEQVADDVEELDPLTDMLARLQEAALRYSDHDSDGSESVIVPL